MWIKHCLQKVHRFVLSVVESLASKSPRFLFLQDLFEVNKFASLKYFSQSITNRTSNILVPPECLFSCVELMSSSYLFLTTETLKASNILNTLHHYSLMTRKPSEICYIIQEKRVKVSLEEVMKWSQTYVLYDGTG